MQPQVQLAPPAEASAQTMSPDTEGRTRWNAALKIAFRFAFSYLVLYCFPFPLGGLPYTGKPAEWYELGWHKVVPWVAQHWLRLAHPITTFSNGSGDTTYDYIKVLCFLVIAAAATIVWSVWDRKHANYVRLHQWLRLYVRITLGATLLAYGAYKVIPSQFPPPWQWRYLETYGDSSPMGILWTFMGASKSYTIFAGAVEMLGGILLFLPRLATLGALIGISAMANVFILNMSYDVPVKLYSFHLLAMGAFLVLPEIKRLARFFVLNRATEPAPAELRFQRKWLNRSVVIGQLALGLFFAGYTLYQSKQSLTLFRTNILVKPPLYGTWSVDEFAVDGQLRPPLLTDAMRWQRAVFENSAAATVQGMDSKLLRLPAKIDQEKKTVVLTKPADAAWKASLNYALPTNDTMVMEGQLAGQKVQIKLHRLENKYLLNTRGFHWINEFPFNR
ncbi:MAG TPA: hypothetical protein VFQ41_01850 [Candidatus Angelobacter sp.]|nr:hypothetical protein [Candidatus Angelobacter sp.]